MLHKNHRGAIEKVVPRLPRLCPSMGSSRRTHTHKYLLSPAVTPPLWMK